MLFSLSLSLLKKKKKRFFKNKYTVHNWDLVHCLQFRLYYFKKFLKISETCHVCNGKQ